MASSSRHAVTRTWRDHICGFYIYNPSTRGRNYLPQVNLEAHATIVESTCRTTLTQTFANPHPNQHLDEIRYTFPLYDGVSVVGFTCAVDDRLIRSVVKERQTARSTYDQAVARGETAGLLEQLPAASDVFTTTIGNIPAGAKIIVTITYLGELKHDAQVDGIRLTIPTNIAPRYASYESLGCQLMQVGHSVMDTDIRIVVDAEVANGSQIKSIQTSAAPTADPSFQRASGTLALGTTGLDKDFILHVVATNVGKPLALLEQHPTLPNHRALMMTLVPKFNLAPEKPEIVFVCDRSGSMDRDKKIPNLQAALRTFVKSLSIGTKFNICSFGTRYDFLWDRSRTYDSDSVDEAMRHIDTFNANYGGTEMYAPMEDTFRRRYLDMNLEVFLLTDGEIWAQQNLFELVNDHVSKSEGAIRVFTLGIGMTASSALVEGVARAGNGFSQSVGDSEEMSSKIVQMLKAATFPHVKEYSLEVKYGSDYSSSNSADEEQFEHVDMVKECLAVSTPEAPKAQGSGKGQLPRAAISLFDQAVDSDVEMMDDNQQGGGSDIHKYSHLPTVERPNLYQTPFNIPPLFPFNRTTVYILLSPDTNQAMPTSVILKGASTQGLLELEIPVTVLQEKGETIHQLAAKKAMAELEESRGWIFHARASDGRLLKEKYEGRFSDMVEREAVRLGLQFQVGGKWCSFVAVETDKDGVIREQEYVTQQNTGGIPEIHSMLHNKRSIASKAARKSANSFGGGPRPSRLRTGDDGDEDDTTTPGAVCRRALLRGPSDSLQPFGTAATAKKSRTESADRMQELIVLQTFEGYWTWTSELMSLMGWDNAAMCEVFDKGITMLPHDEAVKRTIMATTFVVAWLRKERASNQGSWELLVGKAVAWLEHQLAPIGERSETLIAKAMQMV
ncbi:von Willebrand factor type A domain-containing protein [Xylariomycetidae sp. FL2044]|nr:von Willebrand factor type A domain-containing protein [Xylariomycetidae sp. FL2044]